MSSQSSFNPSEYEQTNSNNQNNDKNGSYKNNNAQKRKRKRNKSKSKPNNKQSILQPSNLNTVSPQPSRSTQIVSTHKHKPQSSPKQSQTTENKKDRNAWNHTNNIDIINNNNNPDSMWLFQTKSYPNCSDAETDDLYYSSTEYNRELQVPFQYPSWFTRYKSGQQTIFHVDFKDRKKVEMDEKDLLFRIHSHGQLYRTNKEYQKDKYVRGRKESLKILSNIKKYLIDCNNTEYFDAICKVDNMII